MNVTVYSTPSCPYCHMVKAFLEKRGTPFQDFDVSRDPLRAQEMVLKSGQMGVPVIDVGGKIFVGYQPGPIGAAIDAALAKASA
jgi:glutaredoxin 3